MELILMLGLGVIIGLFLLGLGINSDQLKNLRYAKWTSTSGSS
jgi:hypothetical protein